MAKKTASASPAGDSPRGVALTIKPPAMAVLKVLIEGKSPYCQQRFSRKVAEEMRARQEAGSTANKGSKRQPKDFDECYKNALYRTTDGWHGIPAGGIRTAMISACRIVGFHMTKGKLAVFVEADGFDAQESKPLVRITKGDPTMTVDPMKNDNGGADLRVRGLWAPGWQAVVRVKFDSDIFTAGDTINLLSRVGEQVGLGEGRHDSRECAGCGWGTFEIKGLVD